MVPGACGPSEGSLNERGEEEKEEEEREEEEGRKEEAIESVETQLAACGNRKQKQKVREMRSNDIDQNKQIDSRRQHNVKSNTIGTHRD